MSKARWADGLRRGSTKTKTYSTLSTRKEGRVQIIKDRVYDVANPQTISQMQQRVIFATVTSAAKHMYPLISISQEGETKPEYARQLFISQNVELLKRTIGKRVGLQNHYLSALAPKNNEQLIPNSYQVSKGSLPLPEYLIPKTGTEAGGTSFAYAEFDAFGKTIIDQGVESYSNIMGVLTVGSTYNAAQLWQILFGMLPGDQLTVPQVYGEGVAQALYAGDEGVSEIIDKTLVTEFCAPRLVLLNDMPATTITIAAATTAAQIATVMRAGVNADASYTQLVDNIMSAIAIDELQENDMMMKLDGSYDSIYAVGDGTVRALGVILSRIVDGSWKYSTSNLVCVWDFLANNSGADYFGFTLDNAIETYLTGVKTTANGNFLQRGGTPDIVPESFQ